MKPNENTNDEMDIRLQRVLRAIDSSTPAPDAAFLDELKQRSLDAFNNDAPSDYETSAVRDQTEFGASRNSDHLVTASESKPSATQPDIRNVSQIARTTSSDTSAQQLSTPSLSEVAPKRRNPMITLAIRGICMASAAATLIAAWLVPVGRDMDLNAAPFSQVIDELRGATSLHMQLVRDGQTSQVWVRSPGLVRKEESPQKYTIAAGSRLWRIDESTNTAIEGDSPWFNSPDQQVDLVALLDVGVDDATALLRSKPRESLQIGGHKCFVYRAKVASGAERIDLEAIYDSELKRLTTLRALRGPNALLAEMTLIAMNEKVADEKFAVAKSLTEDGRIGKVNESQGIAVIRPMLSKRWTPLQQDLVLKPGDWLRTELRGANAVKVTFSSEIELTVGPGSLIECLSPTQARLHSGEVQVNYPHRNIVEESLPDFTLLAPRAGKHSFKHGNKKLIRVDRDEQLVVVPQTPVWLAGFEGTSANESLGSLIVKLPDGRNEPLTVGYHKVSVEIRDQIARTTIEESFVNHTTSRLEGTFHFPLPQDASISGFGMWIGNDLVEADIVEKQRAREIYETILREKRDPGLLEWTSGNLFKARVFPIEALSEKRVKIVYTQVLPLRGNRYRYSYGLRSDLLRAKPLRELNLSVKVNSALPLKSVKCPTHTVRTQQAGHSAQVEFAAQEYSPNRDFEVVFEVDSKQSDVVVIPHRRGDDGYLLVQLTPPGGEGNWQRELIPDGKPLNVVLLCDTSASMDSEKRRQQAEFVATVLSSLGTEDRFQLAACDVGVEWANAGAVSPNDETITKAKDFLAKRVSLGWTNLDRAFGEVIKKSPADAQVIYIGDGIVSAGDTDPAAFVKRLGQLVQSSRHVPHDESRTKDDEPKQKESSATKNANSEIGSPHAEREGYSRTFHAVTVGNISEAVVLKGIASMGGGSVRTINGEQTGVAIARELLNEISQPGLRDLKVEFQGVKVAAVYPERLPNIAAGMQQILVGRYLPEGKDQTGEIIVTGRRGTEAVRFVAKINFKDAEDGNSFIPRLWARGHLDYLLAQGKASAVRDDIIALSEQFHIITPYTSLLVLETDADRERFGVKRRYEMRDGERFFAEGRSAADFELVQQQMKQSRSWRLNMRARVLRSLSQLGRDPQAFQQRVQLYDEMRRVDEFGVSGHVDGPFNSSGPYPTSSPAGGAHWGFAGGLGGGGGMPGSSLSSTNMFFDAGSDSSLLMTDGSSPIPWDRTRGNSALGNEDWFATEELSLGFGANKLEKLKDVQAKSMRSISLGDRIELAGEKGTDGFDLAELQIGQIDSASGYIEDLDELQSLLVAEPENALAAARPMKAQRGVNGRDSFDFSSPHPGLAGGLVGFKRKAYEQQSLFKSQRGYEGYGYQQDYTRWLRDLFPALPDRPRHAPKTMDDPAEWSPDALALSRSLIRAEALSKLDGGVELKRLVVSTDPRWKRQSGRNSDLVLYSPKSWLTRTLDLDQQTVINFATATERGAYSLAYLLGQVRASHESELTPGVLALSDSSLTGLHEMYRGHVPKVEPAGDGRVTLLLTTTGSNHSQRILIDTARHVILKNESLTDGKVLSTTSFDDFIEIAGHAVARKITVTDEKGRTTSETTLDVKVLSADEFAKRITTETEARPRVQFLHSPATTLAKARQNAADGRANFDDRITLLIHFASRQQWDDVLKQIESMEQLARGDAGAVAKPGVRWIRSSALVAMRRNEEARQRYLAEAKQLASNKSQDEVFLARAIYQMASSVGTGSETMDLVNLIKPVFERQPADLGLFMEWQEWFKNALDSLGRTDEATALRRELITKQPWHLHWHEELVRRLAARGEMDAAEKWLRDELARDIERNAWEADTLRGYLCDHFRARGQWDRWLKFTEDWIATNPESQSWNSAYAQHLSALVYNDRLEDAYKKVEQWLTEVRTPEKLSPQQLARFESALYFVQGSAFNLSFQRPDDRWHPILADSAWSLMSHEHHSHLAERIFQNHYFQQSDACDRLRGKSLQLLRTDLAKLTPSQISFLRRAAAAGRLDLVEPINDRKQLNAEEVPLDIWKAIAAELRARWSKTEKRDDRHSLGTTLSDIYSSRFADTEALPFLRERIATAPDDLKPGYRDLLFTELVSRPWTEQLEQEAFQTLRLLSRSHLPHDTAPEGRISVQLPALMRLVDAMLANRAAKDEQTLRDAGELNKLTRKELATKRAEMSKATRTAFASRLDAEATKEEEARGLLAPWIRMEHMWLDVQLGQNLDKVEERCWALLGEVPPNVKGDQEQKDAKRPGVPSGNDDEDEVDPAANVKRVQEALHSLLRQRAFITVMNMATRKKATQASIDRVLKYIDAGIQSNPEALREAGQAANDATNKLSGTADVDGDEAKAVASALRASWRSTKFQFLIALDRADDLEQELRTWVREDQTMSPWRQSLARLLAERGKLDEAISIFESCEKDKLLSSSDFQMFSNWYLAMNRRADHDRAKLEAFKQMPEGNLANSLYSIRNRWYQGQNLPSELDETSLLTFKALFAKSANPENYLWQLRDLYAACRDFRLLHMLPDAVLGRSPQQIYAYLNTLNGQVLHELRNESTADEILAQIKTLREGDRTSTDLRALDLLEALVERKSSEVLNQPGPHVEKCLAALRRAFERDWQPGEPRLMASFLVELGGLSNGELAAEQLRELKALQAQAPANSRDHLYITRDLCNLIGWNYTKFDEAIRMMEIEVRSYAQANGGQWPHEDNDVLGSFAMLHHGGNRYAAGEAVLLKWIATTKLDEQRKYLRDRLIALYNHALEHKGEVTLGKGLVLYNKIIDLGLADLDAAADENERYSVVARLCSTFDIAWRNQLGGVERLEEFVFVKLPTILKKQQSQYRNTVQAPLQITGQRLTPQKALRYVVERLEQYPQRFEVQWDNGWQGFGYELARRREAAAKDMGDLEPRVLALAIKELKRELRHNDPRNQYIYYRHYSHFWAEKAADFAKVANEIYAERKTSGRQVRYIANYLRSGLEQPARAIEILMIAYNDGILDASAQQELITILHNEHRYGESIPLLERLLKATPDSMHYSAQLMYAYYRSDRPEQLATLVKQTDELFHKEGRWVEEHIRALGDACLNCQLNEQAAAYLSEAISLHLRDYGSGGLNDVTLSYEYQNLAEAQSRLGRTKEAIDAASAAIVCWAPDIDNRTHAIQRLNDILRQARDLDDFVKHLDAEAAKNGQDSPILRKEIGKVYQAKNELPKAIAQFELALALQPLDREVHQALITCYDANNQPEKATRQLLALLDSHRHDLELFKQLASRMKDNEAEAERAVTSIIESAPNEAESHAALAELRQQQRRWDEAIPHWQQVAELRRLEPTGLLKLAAAQIQLKNWEQARKTIETLNRMEWPARFSNVQSETQNLLNQIPK